MNKKQQIECIVLFSVILVGWGTLGSIIYTKIDTFRVEESNKYLYEAKKSANDTDKLVLYERAAALNPNEESFLGSGITALRLGDNGLAEKYLSRVKTEAGYYQLGMAQYNLGNYQAAILAFERASRLVASPETYLAIAKARLKLGELDGAGAALAESLRLGENNEASQLFRSLSSGERGYNAFQKFGYPQAAQELLTSMSRNDQLTRDGLLTLANGQIIRGEYETSYVNLLKAKQIDPYYPQTYKQLIIVSEKLGKNQEVKEYQDFLGGLSI